MIKLFFACSVELPGLYSWRLSARWDRKNCIKMKIRACSMKNNFPSICSLPTKLLKRPIRKSSMLAPEISKEWVWKNGGIYRPKTGCTVLKSNCISKLLSDVKKKKIDIIIVNSSNNQMGFTFPVPLKMIIRSLLFSIFPYFPEASSRIVYCSTLIEREEVLNI